MVLLLNDGNLQIFCTFAFDLILFKTVMGFLNLKNMSDISYYSPEGLKKLKDELVQLEQIERPRVTQEIADARDKGDLSENAEYHAAKEEQSHLEFKIAKLKNVISSARIIDESQLDTSKVLIHSVIKIKNIANGMEFGYTLVADSETDVRNGKLSVNSPIGKGLLGKEVGDIAEIQVPNGIMKFEIMDISR